MSEGKKFDNGKLRWDLVPYEAVEEVVKVLTFGADKYGDYNWQKVEPFQDRYFAALMRHLVAWKKGEDIDPESGVHHLSHAACNCVFLLWNIKTKDYGRQD